MTLPELMVTWKAKTAELKALEQQIAEQVMTLRKTQDVGDVRASYSAGRKSYDYPAACKDVPQEVLDAYTTIIPESRKVDYTALCKGEGIEAPYTQSEPKVTLKLTATTTVDINSEMPI